MSSFFTANATPLFGSVQVWASAAPAMPSATSAATAIGSIHSVPLVARCAPDYSTPRVPIAGRQRPHPNARLEGEGRASS